MDGRTLIKTILDQSNLAPTSRSKYEHLTERWIRFAGEDPNGWTRLKGIAFYNALIAGTVTRDGKPVHPRSAKIYFASLKLISKWTVKYLNNPNLDFTDIQIQDVRPTKTRHALSQDQFEALLGTCVSKSGEITPYDRRDRTLLIVAIETGMRRSSLAAISTDRLIPSPRFGYPTAYVPIKSKRGEDEYHVPLSDTAVAALDDWREWLEEHRAKNGPVFRRIERNVHEVRGKVQTTYSPKPDGISPEMIYKMIVGRLGIIGIHGYPHLLRHTFITWRTNQRLNAPEIVSITGAGLGNTAWANMPDYIDKEFIGQRTRNSTPPWLAQLVADVLRKG
jgi:integrase